MWHHTRKNCVRLAHRHIGLSPKAPCSGGIWAETRGHASATQAPSEGPGLDDQQSSLQLEVSTFMLLFTDAAYMKLLVKVPRPLGNLGHVF